MAAAAVALEAAAAMRWRRAGLIDVHFETVLGNIPRPMVRLYVGTSEIARGELSLYLGFGDGKSDDIVALSLTCNVPPRITDRLSYLVPRGWVM